MCKSNKRKPLSKLSYLNNMASLFVFCVLVIFVISIMLYRNIIDNSKAIRTKTVATSTEKDADYIVAIKTSIDADLSLKLEKISSAIQSQILSKMDLDLLEEEMNKGNIPAELEAIFSENIKDKNLVNLDGNYTHILICNYDGVISDFSLSRASNDDTRTWQYEIAQQHNTALAQNTVNNILNQNTNSYSVFELYKSDVENHKYLSTMRAEELKRIYITEGLEGIKNYYFIVPSYITDDGDIFGKSDITSGRKNRTNKLIIIQEYNLYDYLVKNNIVDDLFNQEDIDELYNQEFTLYAYGFSTIIFLIVILGILCICSNSIYDRDNTTVELFTRKNPNNPYKIDPKQIIEMANLEKENNNDGSK